MKASHLVYAAMFVLFSNASLASNSQQDDLGKLIDVININTPDNKPFVYVNELRWYASYSQNNACQNLTLIKDEVSGPGFQVAIAKGQDLIYGNLLKQAIKANATCFRMDIVYRNHTYSTGAIQLQSDSNNNYIGASPSAEVMSL